MAVTLDFLRALGQLGDGRFLGVLVKALILTVVLLISMIVGAGWLMSFMPTDLGTWWLIGPVELPVAALQGLAVGAVLVASAFLMIPVAAMFVGFFLDEIADAVEERHYPGLPEPQRGSRGDDILAAIRFTAAVAGWNLVMAIPYLVLLFTIPPLAFALAYGLNGYLLGREYFELVAMRHLAGKDARALRARHWFQIWSAGVLMAIPLTIPVMNLIVPVLGVATITHSFHRLRWS